MNEQVSQTQLSFLFYNFPKLYYWLKVWIDLYKTRKRRKREEKRKWDSKMGKMGDLNTIELLWKKLIRLGMSIANSRTLTGPSKLLS